MAEYVNRRIDTTGQSCSGDDSRVAIGTADLKSESTAKDGHVGLSEDAKNELTLVEHRKEFIFETFEQRPGQF